MLGWILNMFAGLLLLIWAGSGALQAGLAFLLLLRYLGYCYLYYLFSYFVLLNFALSLSSSMHLHFILLLHVMKYPKLTCQPFSFL